LWRTRAGFAAGACTALYQVFFFAGVDRAGVALGTLVTIGSGPVFAGLLSAVLLAERPTRSWIAATGICLVGLGLLSLGGRGSANFESVGVLLALGAGLAYAAYTVAARRILSAGTPSLEVMASAFGLGGVLLLPLLIWQPMSWLPSARGVALALYLGLVTTTVAYIFFGRGLALLPAGPVTTLVLAEPLVATALGIGVLGESLPAIGVVGTVAVLGGLALQGWTAVRGEVTSSKESVG
jgi:DME family drug/metabolite transporter